VARGGGGGRTGGSLGFGMPRKGRTRSETIVARVGVEGARVVGDRRWSWTEVAGE
jgi:hypothetical protein